MKGVFLTEAAESDVRDIAGFYEEASVGLGEDFLDVLRDALSLLSEHPDVGFELPSGNRRLLLRRFPYMVMYRNQPDHVLVLAVGHQRRKPQNRMRGK